MKLRIAVGVLTALATQGAAAQVWERMPSPAIAEGVFVEGQPGVPVMRASTVVEARVTAGRPYSAEATTEFVQVLGDGNKIARKSTVRIYRDSDGRTRREELGTDGTVKSVSIYDPVAHVSYVLDPATRTARQSATRMVYPASKIATTEEDRKKVEAKITAEAGTVVSGSEVVVVGPARVPPEGVTGELRTRVQADTVAGGGGRGRGGQPAPFRIVPDAKEESLGQKVIEGVVADGKRVTTVLPAGAIGNQQPITVLTEQWFSPDLEILLMTRHSDPRTGETAYTVTNIVRAEPQATLFDVPADYTILESPYRAPAR